MTETTSSPSAIPVAYEANVALLHSDARHILDQYSIPYSLQAKLAVAGYVTVELARSNGEADLDFSPTHQGWGQRSVDHTCMRLFQAVRQAQAVQTAAADAPSSSGQRDGVVLQAGKRASLEENYKKVTGSRPPLQEQGSDAFLYAQFKPCEKGEIGFFHTKQMVSAMPDPLEMAATVKGLKPVNGFLYQEDQEERKSPYSKEQWESVLTVFQANLLMCVWAFPNNRLFDLEKSDMDSFYKFLLGDEIAKRPPAPELKVLMHAERAAWRKVALHMHEGLSLKTSLDKVMSNSLFWTREVYEKQKWYPNYEAVKEDVKGKGKAKAEAAAAARARSRTPTPGPAAAGGGKWPAERAEANAKGQQFCRNFHLRSCAIKCGRSRNCPVYKTDGTLMCTGSWKVAKGQPFYLDLMTHTARKAFDMDSEFPLELRHGVPLGVDEETLCSPGVWPTKEELKGQLPEYEDLPPPGSMDNYSSAVLHEDAIEATFYGEEKLDMVIGHSSIEGAAITCGCLPEDLCTGPLGAIEEADELRTIFDGAAPGMNDHIRKKHQGEDNLPRTGSATGPETAWEEEEWVLLKADEMGQQVGVASACHHGSPGLPLSWKQTIMGLAKTWLGFQIQTKLPAAAVGHLKHRVMVALLRDISDGKRFSYDELAEGLGRLQWATNAFFLVKPFLQPFWAWKTAVVTASFPSRLLRMIAKVILLLINSVITSTSPFCPTSSTHGDNAPWAFDKSSPQRRIAALEMFGALLLFRHLAQEDKIGGHSVYIPFLTDNQGNALSILNHRTKKWPCSPILMELVLQAHVFHTPIAIRHVKRDFNIWADALTNSDFLGFCPAKEFVLDISDDSWLLLPKLMLLGKRQGA
ncbi:unnamed protein product [Polarella glacialis]|uniref:Uncharacterized protein n=1 Tax=Polarella glacialis TaxID=89957 RepID=A0A813D713_POLGL|nr:unnamed protein product [Polarella glacialis]